MKVESLIEFVDAAVNTKYVVGPYEERGGLMLVGFPGSFKTTIIRLGMSHHHDSICLSDLNVKQWLKMREDFITQRFTALGFFDFEKIYQRHSSTASHVEAVIKGLVSEGYGTSPNGDQRMPTPMARALVVGGVTNFCFESHYDDWQKSGFLRRFLWIMITIVNPWKITDAIDRWEKINFGKIMLRPANKQITVQLTKERAGQMREMMRWQPGTQGTGYVLLKKIVAVLEWKYSDNGGSKKVTEILNDIAPAMSKEGGRIVL